MGRRKKTETENINVESQKVQTKKSRIKPVGVLKEDEKIEYRKLTDYIQSVYNNIGLDPPWALFMTQIKDIKKNYKLGYIEILHVIQYMIQFEGIDITDRDTLGLIPYFIDKTNNYIEQYKQSKANFKNFTFDEKTIFIKPTNSNARIKRKNESFD